MRELELKFALTLALQDALTGDPAAAGDRVQRVWSCYYDTPDGALARARMAVRVRRHGMRWLQTVKADTGDRFERFEWERPIDGPTPDRSALPPEDTPQGAIAHRSFGQWRALFETDFERRTRRIDVAPGLRVELAQDVGEVRCGERREPIREVELECIDGTRAAFFEWALGWASKAQACLLLPTKNERGLRLAARLPLAPAPVRAIAATPPPDAAPDAAAADVLRSCVAHACANIEPMLASDDDEAPHQFRVALRRLRAALRLFGLRERDPRWQRLDEEASALADAAGRVRDLDVFETGALAELRRHFPADAALESLSRAALDAREAARMDLRRVLTGPATTRFVLGALALAERLAESPGATGVPTSPTATTAATPPARPAGADAAGTMDGPPSAPGDASAGTSPSEARSAEAVPDDAAAGADGDAPAAPERYGAFAHRRVHALLARVRRRARRARDADGWHRTRLSVKTLRYALEFAAGALPRDVDVPRAQAVLARWQERLGAGQDLATARDVAADALARPGVPPEAAVRALALIDGWNAFTAPAGRDPAHDARRALRALRAALGDSAGGPPVR